MGQVPIFVPAFSDCSAGFGIVAHQHARQDEPHVSFDSGTGKEERELIRSRIGEVLAA